MQDNAESGTTEDEQRDKVGQEEPEKGREEKQEM